MALCFSSVQSFEQLLYCKVGGTNSHSERPFVVQAARGRFTDGRFVRCVVQCMVQNELVGFLAYPALECSTRFFVYLLGPNSERCLCVFNVG